MISHPTDFVFKVNLLFFARYRHRRAAYRVDFDSTKRLSFQTIVSIYTDLLPNIFSFVKNAVKGIDF